MRYLILLVVGAYLVYGQCNMCLTDPNRSPTPYGFNPSVLSLPPGKDTSFTVYFTFPDQSSSGSLTVYPNYAVWVDSLKLDIGLIKKQDGSPFAYDASNPAAGPIHFDQMHRYKQWGPGPNDYANFVVYQNPGGTQGQTPPIGCAQICIKTSTTTGIDTLRVKVRAFVPILGDVSGKDTTDLRPQLFNQPAWLDTTFRYPIRISSSASLPISYETYAFRPVVNPVYGEAVLTYTLPTAREVWLRAYTLDGREVWNSYLGLQPAGSHQQTLRLPAGQYFLRLETPYSTSSTRLTVVE